MGLGTWIDLINVVATLAIALFVFVGSRQFTSLQAQREIRSAWITVDLGVASDSDLLSAAEHLMHPEERLDDEGQRRRWICYMIRNPLENFHMSLLNRRMIPMSRASICRDPAFASLNACLQQLVFDGMFMKIVDEFSADSRFKDLCHNLQEGKICQHPRHQKPGEACSPKCLAATWHQPPGQRGIRTSGRVA